MEGNPPAEKRPPQGTSSPHGRTPGSICSALLGAILGTQSPNRESSGTKDFFFWYKVCGSLVWQHDQLLSGCQTIYNFYLSHFVYIFILFSKTVFRSLIPGCCPRSPGDVKSSTCTLHTGDVHPITRLGTNCIPYHLSEMWSPVNSKTPAHESFR